eukprot:9096850-Heterocapsa_arctica.AAC.1
MSYGHQIRSEDLGNQAHIENSDNIVTNAFAQIDKDTSSGIRLGETINIEKKRYEIHAYCVRSKRQIITDYISRAKRALNATHVNNSETRHIWKTRAIWPNTHAQL